jgi:non-specific serine/threonine protein kinase
MTATSDALSDLIGRDATVAEVLRRLESHRLVTITGLGGIGKTSVARAVAAHRSRADGRAIVVDLAAVALPGGVAEAVAVAVGARDDPDADHLAATCRALSTAPTLLVLDNFEHVLPARALVTDLLACAPGLRVLVTSRVGLGLAAESVVALDSLPVPASVRELETAPASALFLRRSRANDRLAMVQPPDAEAVVDICRRLDGVPLAIELAAAWTGILTPRAIGRRLASGRLDLRGDDPRHASVEDVVESTLDLVEPGDRAVFARLGVFVAAFDEAAAQAVTGDGGVLRALRNLDRVALLRTRAAADGEPRFELLETIRAAALRRLADAGESVDARRAHATYFAERSVLAANEVRTTSFSSQDGGARLADPNVAAAFDGAIDLGENDAAIRIAAALASGAMQTGRLRDALGRVETALALSDLSAGARSDGLNALVSVRGALGPHPDQRADALRAVELARESGSPERVVRTLITLGNWSTEGHMAPYAEAAAIADAVGYRWGAATAWGSVASAAWDGGQVDEAIAALHRAMAASAADDDRTATGYWLTQLGEYELTLDRVADGLAHLEEAVAILRASPGTPFFGTASLTLVASARALSGDVDGAYRALAVAAARVERGEAATELADFLEAAVVVLAFRHPLAAARALGGLDQIFATDPFRTAKPLQEAASRRVARAIGTRRFDRERASGRAAGAATVFADTARIVRRAAGPGPQQASAPYGTLTTREQEILIHLAEGRTDREIGQALGITAKTASVHVANLKAKLGVATRVEAALYARNLLGPRPEAP